MSLKWVADNPAMKTWTAAATLVSLTDRPNLL